MTDIGKVLERAPSLNNVEQGVLNVLAHSATERGYVRGDFVWHAGEIPHCLVVIRSGLLKVARASAEGRTSLLGLFGAPDSVGDIAVLKGMPYPADAIVISERATVIEVPSDVFLGAIGECPSLGMSMAQGMHSKLTKLRDKVDVLSAGAVDARLATLILKLYSQFGDDFDDGTSRIPIVLSRRELAQLVSTSFETVIRTMSKWERKGVFETATDGFVVHQLSALRELAGVGQLSE